MHPSSPLLHLLLSLTLLLTISIPISTASPPPDLPSHFTKHLTTTTTTTTATSPQEQIELTPPLPSYYSNLTPSCTLNILSHTFADTINLPPTNDTYSPPTNCTWSRALLHLSGSSNGSQYDRIAAVWLAGAELLRTSTPEPTPDGVFWNVRKDITRYSTLLRQSNLTLSVMLENIVNDVYTGVYHVNLTFIYYDVRVSNATVAPLSSSTLLSLNHHKSNARKLSNYTEVSSFLMGLDENPADLIIPISASGDEGFWFKIERETDEVLHGVQVPLNAYRAVIEVYVSYHGDDEFWYTNPPDAYIETNKLDTKQGHGAYREVLVRLDDEVVGSVVPFPVIFTGGINPLFWEPVVSIGAFDLPSYEIELTPFLAMLLDNKTHYFGLGVADALPFWLVDANLHLWLDDKTDRVQAKAIKYSYPTSSLECESKFQLLDGKFEIEGESESAFSAWVNSSAGNFTTYVSRELEFKSKIKFSKKGTKKKVKQKVKVTDKVKVKSETGILISSISVKRKYPLKLKILTQPGSAKDTYLMNTKLDQSIKEEKSDGNSEIIVERSQKAEGWMFVLDHDVLSGAASSSQSASVEDKSGCNSRRVSAANGYITNDETSLCSAASL